MPWVTRYHRYDGQGNTRLLTDETGTATDSFTYDAWGNEVARTGTTETPFRWNGRVGYYWDEDTGTYQVRRRPYSPKRGRWLTVDPIWPRDGINAFLYSINRPNSIKDPSGSSIIRRWQDEIANNRGFMAVQWKFDLQPASHLPYVLIQRIKFNFSLSSCGKPVRSATARQDFYEVVGIIPAGSNEPLFPGRKNILQELNNQVRSSKLNESPFVQALNEDSPGNLPPFALFDPKLSGEFPIIDTWAFPGCQNRSCGNLTRGSVNNIGIIMTGEIRAFVLTVKMLGAISRWESSNRFVAERDFENICNPVPFRAGSGTFVSSLREGQLIFEGALGKRQDTESRKVTIYSSWTCDNPQTMLKFDWASNSESENPLYQD